MTKYSIIDKVYKIIGGYRISCLNRCVQNCETHRRINSQGRGPMGCNIEEIYQPGFRYWSERSDFEKYSGMEIHAGQSFRGHLAVVLC